MTVNASTGLTVCPTTSYTYDNQHRMITVTDPKGILYLTNQYDSGNRITKQTYADGRTNTFIWTFTNTTHARILNSGPSGRIAPGYTTRGRASCYPRSNPLVTHAAAFLTSSHH